MIFLQVMNMTPHKNNNTSDKNCYQEHRIIKLEHDIQANKNTTEKHEQLLEELNRNIQTLNEIIISLKTTFNTLKWVLGLTVAGFGGIFIFLITELIRLIH